MLKVLFVSSEVSPYAKSGGLGDVAGSLPKALKKEGLKTKIILQVHDELVIDAPEEEKEIAAEILKCEMENAVKLNVPLTVEVHTGKNWYEAK